MTIDVSLLLAHAGTLTSSTPIVDQDARLLLKRDGDLAIYYLPFEYLNPDARMVIVGITPGPTQLLGATREAGALLRAGIEPAEVLRVSKRLAAFSGNPMRPNLIAQLNHWGVHEWLGLADSGELFMTRAERLVHNTSLVRNAAYVRGKPYAGSPKLLATPLLKAHLEENFVSEVRQLGPATMYFSMGPVVEDVLKALVERGLLRPEQLMTGLCHPSPNNTYRIPYLTGNRTGPAPWKTNPRAYDEGRRRFRQVALGR